MGGRGAEVWVSHPFPQHSSSVRNSGPDAFLQPLLHQRGCSRGGHLGLNCQGCCGACSTSFSRLLQPSVRCVEDLGVVASGHRPLPPQSLCGCVPLSDGDHSIRSPVGSSGGLDGLHRLEGRVPPSVGSPGLSSLSTLCVQGSRFPVQSAVLWPLHGSAGLLSGHGSCFRHPPHYGDSYAQVSRRLAHPVCLSGIPPRPLPRVGDRGIVVNPQKSHLVPSQVVQYLGVVINTQTFMASPSQERISRLLSTAAEFRCSASPPASLWLSLLGMCSSLAHLVPGGRLQMRSLQLCLHRSWVRQDLSASVSSTAECLRDLQW